MLHLAVEKVSVVTKKMSIKYAGIVMIAYLVLTDVLFSAAMFLMESSH